MKIKVTRKALDEKEKFLSEYDEAVYNSKINLLNFQKEKNTTQIETKLKLILELSREIRKSSFKVGSPGAYKLLLPFFKEEKNRLTEKLNELRSSLDGQPDYLSYDSVDLNSLDEDSFESYENCLLEAAKIVGIKQPKVYYNIEGGYSGDMDLHLTGKLNGEPFYFFLRQNYGSCSYCDWLENAGTDEVIEEYVSQLRDAMD